jgi:hypothetical protein
MTVPPIDHIVIDVGDRFDARETPARNRASTTPSSTRFAIACWSRLESSRNV